jgi:UDP-N-acetylmuramoyl-tripeptide--D-alanyl-D-alanine ligase
MTIEDLYQLYVKHPMVSTDTRNIEHNSIFFALKGPNFNANSFAEESLMKGAAFAVIDEEKYKKNDKYILVDDVLIALQKLAQYHREKLAIPIIAIVGSNGKTTTKELLSCVLKQQYNVHSTPGNFNNHIGLPLTLLQLTQQHEIAIIEMGANHIGENAELCNIACPTEGIITNNGKDHLEGFGSIEGVAQSNSELYYYLLKNNGTAFVNANDEWLMRMANRLNKKITYAANAENKNAVAMCIGQAEKLRPEITFTYNYLDIESKKMITSNLSGDYNFDNIMAAVCIGKHFLISDDNIQKGIEEYQPTNNRSQVIKKAKNTLYLDAYNANPSSLEASLKNFAAMPFSNKIAIIGDMFEMGIYAEQEHANMIEFCLKLNIDEVWLVGEEFSKHKQGAMKQFLTTVEVRDYLANHALENRNIFIKGSRGMKLETLIDIIA